MKNINIFTCQADALYPWWMWVIFAIALGHCLYELKKIYEHEPDTAEKADFSKVISNLPYLLECIRLAEQRMAELISSIQSLEKKGLAIIAGAAALVSFIVAKDWCHGLPMIMLTISIISCIFSIFFAGFTLTLRDAGIGGRPPSHTINYLLNNIKPENEEWFEGLPDEEKKLVGGEYLKELENCCLCSMILERYENSIQTSEKTTNIKAKHFMLASYFLFVGMYSTAGWLLMQLAYAY